MKAACALGSLLVLATLAGCDEPPPKSAEVRPVRTTVAAINAAGELVSLTGHIRARYEASLAFRIDGRMMARRVYVGDVVQLGQLVAELDPQDQRNALQAAQARLVAARATLQQTRNNFDRQQTLVRQGWSTRVQFDAAEQAFRSAEAEVDAASAQLRIAQDQLSYTELRADSAGSVIATGAEAGEVVRAGQMVVQLARNEGIDAVFDVPADLIHRGSRDTQVEVALTDNHLVHATGRVREVAPQADPTTRNYRIKVSLEAPPAAMRLGATVTGQAHLGAPMGIELPASALTSDGDRPALWVVDRAHMTVALRSVELLRHEPASIVVGKGLEAGDLVVTAGVHALRPGQNVRLTEAK